jgi:hypothetical protein
VPGRIGRRTATATTDSDKSAPDGCSLRDERPRRCLLGSAVLGIGFVYRPVLDVLCYKDGAACQVADPHTRGRSTPKQAGWPSASSPTTTTAASHTQKNSRATRDHAPTKTCAETRATSRSPSTSSQPATASPPQQSAAESAKPADSFSASSPTTRSTNASNANTNAAYVRAGAVNTPAANNHYTQTLTRTGGSATSTAPQPHASAATDSEQAEPTNGHCHNRPQSRSFTRNQAGNSIVATPAKMRAKLARGTRTVGSRIRPPIPLCGRLTRATTDSSASRGYETAALSVELRGSDDHDSCGFRRRARLGLTRPHERAQRITRSWSTVATRSTSCGRL